MYMYMYMYIYLTKPYTIVNIHSSLTSISVTLGEVRSIQYIEVITSYMYMCIPITTIQQTISSMHCEIGRVESVSVGRCVREPEAGAETRARLPLVHIVRRVSTGQRPVQVVIPDSFVVRFDPLRVNSCRWIAMRTR